MPPATSISGNSGNGFDDVVKLQLGELQSSLVTEHRRAVSRFEAKIAALEMENARLRQSCSAAHASEGSKGSKSQPDDAMPAPVELQTTSSHGSSKPLHKTSVLSFEMPHFLDRAGQQQAKQDFLSAVSRSTSVASENQIEFFPALPHQPNVHRKSNQTVNSDDTVDNMLLHDDELNPYEIEFAEKPTKNSVTFDETESLPSVHSTPVEQTRSMERETSSPSDPLFRILPAWDASYQVKGRKSRKLVNVGGNVMSQKNSIGSCYVGYIDDVGWLERKLSGFMVQPISTKRLVWELVSLLLITIDLFVIPLLLITPRGSDLLLAPVWVAGSFWTADIFFTFFTGYTAHMDDSTVEMRPGAVAKKYLGSRFIFDLAVVSCDWVSIVVLRRGADVIAGVVLVIRAFRVFRIVGLVKARNMTDFFLERIRSEVAMISAYVLGILVLLLLLIHVTACMWFGIRDKGGEPGDSCEGTIPGPEAPFLEHYMLSFHFVLALFVGEHIELPRNLLERFFTTTVLAFAFVVTASFVGSLTTAMTRLQIIASERSAQFATLSRYLSDSAISRKLAMRVQRNAKHAYRKRKQHTPEKNVELLALISDPLRAEIHYEIYNPILVRHPFFYSYDKTDMTAMRQICHTVMTEISISRGDVLFSEFEVAAVPKMFFITNGKLSYNRGTWEQTKVSKKHWISEPSLWTTWAHLGSLVARAECQFIAIDATRFANITSHFSTNHASTYAQAFVQMLNSGTLTDIGEDNENTRKLVFEVFEDSLPQNAVAPDWVTKGRTSVMSHESIKSSRSSATFLLSRSCSIEPLQSFLQSVFPVFRTRAMR